MELTRRSGETPAYVTLGDLQHERMELSKSIAALAKADEGRMAEAAQGLDDEQDRLIMLRALEASLPPDTEAK